MQNFKVGECVRWRSQAQGSMSKQGNVVEVIPPKKHPDRKKYRYLAGCGWGRDHESYVVEVKPSKTRKAVHYWPAVSLLSVATPDAE